MGKNFMRDSEKELMETIQKYEAAKAEGRQLYLDAEQFIEIASWYDGESRLDDAQDALSDGLQLHPVHMGLLLEQAYRYLEQEELEKAKEITNRITETYDPEVKLLKAEILLKEDKLDEAREIINTLDLDDSDIVLEAIYLYLNFGYREDAKEWIEKVKDLYSDNEDILTLQAEFATNRQNIEEAIQCYEKLIDISPYNVSYWMGLAKCYFTKGDLPKVIEACDFAIAANDKFSEAYMYKAHCFYQLGNYEEAIELYQEALKYRGILRESCYIFIGMAYAHLENWPKTEEYCSKVIALCERNKEEAAALAPDIYTTNAYAIAKQGRCKEAHRLCKKAIKHNPLEPNVYLTEGKIYLMEKIAEESAQSFHKAIQLGIKGDPEMWYAVGSAYADAGYPENARLYLEEAYKIDPTYEDLAEKLSMLCLITYDIDGFIKYNKACEKTFNRDAILRLLDTPECKPLLDEILERLKEDEENNKSN